MIQLREWLTTLLSQITSGAAVYFMLIASHTFVVSLIQYMYNDLKWGYFQTEIKWGILKQLAVLSLAELLFLIKSKGS